MKILLIVNIDDNRVKIYLDNQQELTLSKDVVYQNGLRKFDELSDSQIEKILEEEKRYHIKQKALSFLKRRIHSRKELFTKLKRHFSESNLIEECLNHLEEKNFINDHHFAELFIQEKIRLKKWSRIKLKKELMLRGIRNDIIEDCLEKFFSNDLEKEKALELAKRKFEQIKSRSNDRREIQQKLQMFLLSKGYEYELISDVVKKILSFGSDDYCDE
jgi:regulatory protein